MTNERLAELAAAGVSIWLDDLSRERLRSRATCSALITEDSVVGVTTNPTIFAAALANGEAYDQQVRELAARGASVDDAVREITVADVAHGCDVFRGTWEATDGVDGRVSLEVDPRLAHDTDATVRRGRSTCGRPSTGPTCWSRSRPPRRACPRSPRRSARASA